MSALLETIATYVPSLIVDRFNRLPGAIREPTVESFPAIVLFADVSGFTATTSTMRSPATTPAGIVTV